MGAEGFGADYYFPPRTYNVQAVAHIADYGVSGAAFGYALSYGKRSRPSEFVSVAL
jgi:hypothetical protein